jgi:hypothetical protein
MRTGSSSTVNNSRDLTRCSRLRQLTSRTRALPHKRTRRRFFRSLGRYRLGLFIVLVIQCRLLPEPTSQNPTGSVVNPIAARYPQHRRKSMWFGAILCSGTLLGASYATEVSLLGVSSLMWASLSDVLCTDLSTGFSARRIVCRRRM